MRFIVYILTVLLIAYYAAVLKVYVDDGQYWVLPVGMVITLILGYYVGDEADKDSYRDAWRWITAKFWRRL